MNTNTKDEMKPEEERNGDVRHELATAPCSRLVMPAGLAEVYLSECDGPYRRVFRSSVKKGGEWAYFYKGRKRVWDCNSRFARKHFYIISANPKLSHEGDNQQPNTL